MVNTTSRTVSDIKVFVPAKDFQQSLKFYEALGWKINWTHKEDLAEMEIGGNRFFLQNYYQKDWAYNFMLYININDAQAWYEHAKSVIEQGDFGEAKIKAPELQAHGDIVTYVWDPGGALLHFAQQVKG